MMKVYRYAYGLCNVTLGILELELYGYGALHMALSNICSICALTYCSSSFLTWNMKYCIFQYCHYTHEIDIPKNSQKTFSVNGQIVNNLGLPGHMLCPCPIFFFFCF